MSDTIMLDDALIHHMYLVMRAFTKGVNEALKPLNLYSSEWTVLNFVAASKGKRAKKVHVALNGAFSRSRGVSKGPCRSMRAGEATQIFGCRDTRRR